MTLRPLALALAATSALAQIPPPPQQAGPEWMAPKTRDLFQEAEQDPYPYSESTCDLRRRILSELSSHTEPQALQARAFTHYALGMCQLNNKSFKEAHDHFAAAVTDLGAPSESQLLSQPQTAPMLLLRDATRTMQRDMGYLQAAASLRRAELIMSKDLDQVIKMTMKQHNIPPSQREQIVPRVLDQPHGRILDGGRRVVEQTLRLVKSAIEAHDNGAKKRPAMLEWVPALPLVRAEVKEEACGACAALEKAVVKRLKKTVDELDADEAVTVTGAAKLFGAVPLKKNRLQLVTRGAFNKAACAKEGAAWLCDEVKQIADIATNGFGEAAVEKVKTSGSLRLGTEVNCETNGNLGVALLIRSGEDGGTLAGGNGLIAARFEGGGEVHFAGADDAFASFAFSPCHAVVVDVAPGTIVVHAEAWHPMLSTLERAVLMRRHAEKTWSWDPATLKAHTALNNSHAKLAFSRWFTQFAAHAMAANIGQGHLQLREGRVVSASERAREARAADDAELTEDALAERRHELERKRATREAAMEARRQQSEARLKDMAERKRRETPWLLDEKVVALVELIKELKAQRRTANDRLAFDDASSLTTDLGKAERRLEKVTEKVRKRWLRRENQTEKNKHNAAGGREEEKVGRDEAEKVDDVNEKESLRERMKEAAAAEDYALAKKYKKQLAKLEEGEKEKREDL